MVTFAVQLRNRRKWAATPSESEIRVPSYAGVDTFRISCWVQFDHGPGLFPHELFIAAVHEAQQQLRKGKGTTELVEVLGESFSVSRTGSTKGGDGKKGPYYPYVVTWRGIRFEFQQFAEATQTIPNVIVYAASTPLIAKRGDWEAVWDEARYCLENVLRGRITETAVGRLDIFTDQPGQTMAGYLDLFYRNCFVRRSRLFQLLADAATVEAEVVQGYLEAARKELAVRIMAKGLQATGMYLGGSGILCRIYDKLRELEDTESLTKFEAMKAAFWNGGVPKELCRVEFQMKTRQLREAGITDVESLRCELRNVAGWLCNSWLTVREEGVDRNHAGRTGLHPDWCGVVDAVAARFGGGWHRGPRVVPLTPDPDSLIDQAMGCVCSALAQGDFPGSPEETLERIDELWLRAINKAGLNTTFRKIKRKVEERHARIGSAFTDLQRRGRSEPLDVLDCPAAVRFADYSLAPGGSDGVGRGAVHRPDARLAMRAMGDEPVEFAEEDWQLWQRTYRWGPGGRPSDRVEEPKGAEPPKPAGDKTQSKLWGRDA